MKLRSLAAALVVLLALPASAQTIPNWTVSTETHTYDPAFLVWQMNTGVGTGTNYDPGSGNLPLAHDEWGYLYLPDFGLPVDLKSVTFIGQMLISHGGPGNRHCDMYLHMNDDPQQYGQVVEWHGGGSPRQNFAAVAPVHNGMISLKWRVANPATIQYPGMPFSGNCNYGIFLRVAQATR